MLSIAFACLWVLVASAIAMAPGNWHWRAAYILIAVGIPILGYVTLQNGPVAGLVVLAGGASILRWPLRFLGRWVMRQVGRPAE